MKVKIPFKPQFENVMLGNVKTCTSRNRFYGVTGDTFDAFGSTFWIFVVDKMILRDVSALLYKEEGCESPEEFEKVWAKIHPRKGFVWNQEVYVYHFKKLAPSTGEEKRR